MKRASIAVFSLLLAVAVGAVLANAGEKVVKVKVGPSASQAEATNNHDVTVEKLEEGQTDYLVRFDGQNHSFSLTEEQISDVLDGTTVMVEIEGSGTDGGLHVSITVEEKEEKKSGW